ncbi:MAG: anhydro-N-acetylmuramic acid kinase [Cellvibrionaceae bacterium]
MDLYIGLLSGTSADAIDGILVDLSDKHPNILQTLTLPIPEETKSIVFDLAISGSAEIEKIRLLDQQFANLFSETTNKLCKAAGIETAAVKAIGSHGQTIRHYPPNTSISGYSLQIGDPNIIVEQTGITTVADFRRRDIAAGGHGAPLAPALHNAVFRSDKVDRIVLNTGGIANITHLSVNGEVLGFDTGPANGLMDSWCQRHTQQPYDNNGQWAATGIADNELLNQLLQHPFFALKAPKSTGREDFNLIWLEQQLSKFGRKLSPENVQATLLSLTTNTIAQAIDSIDQKKNAEVYICGGGAHNGLLVETLKQALSPRQLSSTEALGISPDWVEAVAFAWLAKQTIEGKTGNLPSVTGAKKEVILGGIFQA